MPHPGFDWTRKSFHAYKVLGCPRYAYFKQRVGLRNKPIHAGITGPKGAGSAFHAMMEVHYTPAWAKGRGLPGTDGHPILDSIPAACDWLVDAGGLAPSAVSAAYDAYKGYILEWGERDEIHEGLIGRPEPNINADLSNLLPARERKGPIPYSTQYDGVMRVVAGVAIVEHKLLTTVDTGTVDRYRASGQMLGHCAAWNARPDLVEKHGPMTRVLLNLTTKSDTKRKFHREVLFVPLPLQLEYVRTIQRLEEERKRLVALDTAATTPVEKRAVWAKLGQLWDQCVPWAGSPCDFLNVCTSGEASSLLYQIAEPLRARALADGVVKYDPAMTTYTVENTHKTPDLTGGDT